MSHNRTETFQDIIATGIRIMSKAEKKEVDFQTAKTVISSINSTVSALNSEMRYHRMRQEQVNRAPPAKPAAKKAA